MPSQRTAPTPILNLMCLNFQRRGPGHPSATTSVFPHPSHLLGTLPGLNDVALLQALEPVLQDAAFRLRRGGGESGTEERVHVQPHFPQQIHRNIDSVFLAATTPSLPTPPAPLRVQLFAQHQLLTSTHEVSSSSRWWKKNCQRCMGEVLGGVEQSRRKALQPSTKLWVVLAPIHPIYHHGVSSRTSHLIGSSQPSP